MKVEAVLLAAFVLFLSPAVPNLDRNTDRNHTSSRYKAIILFWKLSIANQGKTNIDKNTCEPSNLRSFLLTKLQRLFSYLRPSPRNYIYIHMYNVHVLTVYYSIQLYMYYMYIHVHGNYIYIHMYNVHVQCTCTNSVIQYIHVHLLLGTGTLCFYYSLLCYAQILSFISIMLPLRYLLCSHYASK